MGRLYCDVNWLYICTNESKTTFSVQNPPLPYASVGSFLFPLLQGHIGDWGGHFGMSVYVIYVLKNVRPHFQSNRPPVL
jgi:hypothetical protein